MLLLLLFTISDGTGPSYCYSDRDSQIESSAYFSFNDGGSIQSGFPTICFNNTKRPYCLSDQSIQQGVADVYCGESMLIIIIINYNMCV